MKKLLLSASLFALFAAPALAAPPVSVQDPTNSRYSLTVNSDGSLNFVCVAGCSNSIGAITIADGADTTEGAKADTVCATATGTCTISALLKFLNNTASGTSVHYTGSITNTAVAVDASAGTLWGYYFYNPNASVCYVQFWNTAQGSVTVGTTTPVLTLGIPATGAANVQLGVGDAFSTAITIAATTARAGGTACASNVDANIWYK